VLNLFKKQPPIGIDISDYSIEVLQLTKGRKVLAYGRILLEEGIVKDGLILQKQKLVEKIKEVLRYTRPNRLEISKKLRVILSLPESKTFIYYFELPGELEGENLKQKIFEEASKIVPFGPQEIYWDYLRILDSNSFLKKNKKNKEENKEKGLQRILYVGALREIVDSYIEVMELVGLDLIVLDIEADSLSRALLPGKVVTTYFEKFVNYLEKFIYGLEDSMIIDIGARTTNVSIFNKDGVLNLSIVIPIAGNHFTKAIAQKLGKNKEEAELLKRNFGFDEEKLDNKVLPILQLLFQKIIRELKKAIEYYEEKVGREIKKIILAGGSSLLPKIDKYIEANLEKRVILGSPLDRIKNKDVFDIEVPAILFANVVGLALRGVYDINKGINLLSREQKIGSNSLLKKILKIVKTKKVFITTFCVLVFVFISLLLLGFALYRFFFKTPIGIR